MKLFHTNLISICHIIDIRKTISASRQASRESLLDMFRLFSMSFDVCKAFKSNWSLLSIAIWPLLRSIFIWPDNSLCSVEKLAQSVTKNFTMAGLLPWKIYLRESTCCSKKLIDKALLGKRNGTHENWWIRSDVFSKHICSKYRVKEQQ